MATPTYTLINSTTLTTTTANIVLSSLPQGFGDLILVISGTMAVAGVGHGSLKINSLTSYNRLHAWGDGSTTGFYQIEGTSLNYFSFKNDFSTSEVNSVIVQMNDYSATDKHKTGLTRSNLASGQTEMGVFTCPTFLAITSLTIGGDAGYKAGTTINLYGIAKAL